MTALIPSYLSTIHEPNDDHYPSPHPVSLYHVSYFVHPSVSQSVLCLPPPPPPTLAYAYTYCCTQRSFLLGRSLLRQLPAPFQLCGGGDFPVQVDPTPPITCNPPMCAMCATLVCYPTTTTFAAKRGMLACILSLAYTMARGV